MTTDLTTTNVLLGIMAAVSVIEGAALIALLTAGYLLCRRLIQIVDRIERNQVAPIAGRVNAILDDVQGVTGAAKGMATSADAGVRFGLAWVLRFLRTVGRRAA